MKKDYNLVDEQDLVAQDTIDMLDSGYNIMDNIPVGYQGTMAESAVFDMLDGSSTPTPEPVDPYKKPQALLPFQDSIESSMRYFIKGVAELESTVLGAFDSIFSGMGDPRRFMGQFAQPIGSGGMGAMMVPAPRYNPDAKIEIFGELEKSMRDAGERVAPGNPEEVADKIAYYSAHLIPEMYVLGKIGQAAEGISQAANFFSPFLARLSAVSAYGGATGGLEKARDFAVLDILSMPFQRFSRPVRAIAMSGLMSEYASLTNDPNSPNYDPDAPLIGGIMGLTFGLMGPAGKQSWKDDVGRLAQNVKNWTLRQQRGGKNYTPQAYVEDVQRLQMDIAIRSLNYNHKVLEPVKEVQNWVHAISGEPTKATGKELRGVLQDTLMKSPGSERVTAQKARDIANEVVTTAERIEGENTKLYRGLIGEDMPTEEDVLNMEPVEIDGNVVYRDPAGKQALQVLIEKRAAREVVEGQVRAKEGKVVVQGASRSAAIINRDNSISAMASDLARLTIAPEGNWMKMLNKYPKFKARVKDLYNMMYTSTDVAGIYIDEAWEATGYTKLDSRYQDFYRRYVSAKRDLDIYKRKSPKFAEKDWMTKDDAKAELNLIEDIIRNEQGELGLARFQEQTEAYFEHEHLALRRLVDAGIVSEEAYENMREIHYATSKLIHDVESEAIMSDFGVFDTSTKGGMPVKSLLAPHGGFRSEDVMYLLNRSIFISEAAINKNKFYRELHNLAAEYPNNPIASVVKRPAFRLRADGKWEGISQETYKKIIAQKKVTAEKRKETRARDPRNTIIYEETRVANSKEIKRYKDQKRTLLKQYESMKKETDKLFNRLGKTDAEKKSDTKTRYQREDFAREQEKLEEIIYDINELKEHIVVESDIIDSLKWELDTGHRVRLGDAEAPKGMDLIEYNWNSETEYVAVPKDLKPLMRIRGEGGKSIRDARNKFWLRVATGVPVIKAASVALNPLFGPKSIPRDLNYFAMTDSEVPSLIEYNTRVAKRILPNLRDALKQQGFYIDYRKAGGFAGESGTMAGLAMESIGGRGFKNRMNDYRSVDPKIRGPYQKGVRALGYLSAMSEVAVRMTHAQYLHETKGYSVEAAVKRTNELLNFKRKGPMMEMIDDFYAFAGARGQVLDGFLRAAKNDWRKIKSLKNLGEVPEDLDLIDKGTGEFSQEGQNLFAMKMTEYALARLSVIGLAYAIADKYMADLPVDFKINNWLIPIPGFEVEDENGQPIQGAVRFVNEVNPATAMIDSLIYRAFDRKYGHDSPERKTEYWSAWMGALAPTDVGSIPPNMKALLALYFNTDPDNYEAIWRDYTTGIPEEWAKENTNVLAHVFSDVIRTVPIPASERVSPVAVEKLANAYGLSNNISTGFLGSLFSTPSYEANKSTARAVYEFNKPFFKTFMHWERTGVTGTRVKRMAQEATSHSTLNVRNKTSELFGKIKQGLITKDQAFDILENMDIEGADYFDKISALQTMKRKVKGWSLWKETAELYPDAVRKFPRFSDLQLAASLPDKARLEIYDYWTQSMDSETKEAFDYVAPGFGLASPRFKGREELKREMQKLERER